MPFVDEAGNTVPVQPISPAPVPLTPDQQAAASYPSTPPAPTGINFAPLSQPIVDVGTPAPAQAPPIAPAPSAPLAPPPTNPRSPAPANRAPAPQAPAAPAAPAPAPGADSLAALAALTKKEEDAKDAAYKVEQQGLNETAAQTEKNQTGEAQLLQKQKVDRAAQKIQSDAATKAANQPYHDFQISTGRQIIASLGMILGGFSYDPHHVNQAVQIYQDAIKQDFAKQQADHENLWKTAQQAIDAGRQLSTDQLQELKEYEIQGAEKLSAIYAKNKSLAAYSNNEYGKVQLEKINFQLAEGIKERSLNAARLDQQLNLQKDAQRETVRHNKVEEGNQRINAEAAVKTAGNVQEARETQEAVSALKEVGANYKKIADKIVTDYEEAKKASDSLHSGNSEEIQLGKDSLIRAATGGKITKYTDVAGMRATGGISTQLANAIESWHSGMPSTDALKVLTDAADDQLRAQKKKAADTNASFVRKAATYPTLVRLAKGHEPGWLDNLSKASVPVPIDADETSPAAAPQGPAEGAHSVDAKGRNVIFSGGKWGPA